METNASLWLLEGFLKSLSSYYCYYDSISVYKISTLEALDCSVLTREVKIHLALLDAWSEVY